MRCYQSLEAGTCGYSAERWGINSYVPCFILCDIVEDMEFTTSHYEESFCRKYSADSLYTIRKQHSRCFQVIPGSRIDLQTIKDIEDM